jgi:hypothetical protein
LPNDEIRHRVTSDGTAGPPGGIGSWLPVAAQILRPAVVARHG